MKNVILLLCGGIALALISGAVLTGRDARVPVFVSHHENVLGTSFELKISTLSEAMADAAESAALHEIDRLAKVLSTYDPASEVSRWLRTTHQPVPVSAELFEVLSLFDTRARFRA